jgi:protein-disulfide isomerase
MLDIHHLWIIRKKISLLFIPYFCSVALIIFFFPKYWEFAPPANYSEIPVGVTEEGYQWIGAENPELTITEFTDYQCFGCKKMHFYIRKLIEENPGKIRLVHRYYPMDSKYNFAVKNTFHENSGILAIIAIYASTQGKFWETNDLLYHLKNKNDFSISDVAHQANLNIDEVKNALTNSVYLNKLRIDLWDGYKLGIKSTPAYVINGKVYKSSKIDDMIKKAIEKSK